MPSDNKAQPADAEPKRLRVVHVITRMIVGGAQENTLLSCEGQHDRGHEVTLLAGPTEGPEGSLVERASRYGYRFSEIPSLRRSILPRKDWATYHDLRQRLRDLKPDVVHTHSSKAGILGRLAAWDEGVPHVVHTVHGLSFTASTRRIINRAYVQLERYAATRCHTIIGVADAMNRQMLAHQIGRPEQYETVYSGMEIEHFLAPDEPRDVVRQRLGLAERHVAVATVARLFDLKGHDDLLDHADAMCKQNRDLRFVWVGDGALRGRFEQRIEAMGLADRFILVGLVPPEEVAKYVTACDVLAHPSRREGLARALPQGQLAGLPVVCYEIDGNAEGLEDGRTGFTVKPFETKSFTGKLLELAGDSAKRETMGRVGRDFARSRFASETMVDRLEEVYRRDVAPPDRQSS